MNRGDAPANPARSTLFFASYHKDPSSRFGTPLGLEFEFIVTDALVQDLERSIERVVVAETNQSQDQKGESICRRTISIYW